MKLGSANFVKHKSDHRRGASGFSLLETMISMAVAGLTIAAIHAGVSFGVCVVQSSRENLRANQILLDKMETLRLYTFEQITTPGFVPSTFSVSYDPLGTNSSTGLIYTGRITIADAPLTTSYASDLRKVTVEINWTSSEVLHRREASTLVLRNGLQSYIY